MNYRTSIQNLLDKTLKHPNKAYLHQPIQGQWHSFTWSEVEHQARCIASGLKAQGFAAGSRIAILSKNCAEWFIADLAISMAQMISVPIYYTAGESTIRYILKQADIKAIFVGKLDDTKACEQAITPEILRIAFPYPTINTENNWQDWLYCYAPLLDIHNPKSEDTATIVFTSGTTGNPKGLVITHKNIAAAVQSMVKVLSPLASDHCISYLPLAHITERTLIEASSLYVGNEVFFVESMETFIDNLKYAKPNFFLSVPRLWLKFQLQIINKFSEKKLNFLLSIPLINTFVAWRIRCALGLQYARIFGCGTAPISISVLQWFQKIGIPISEGWGMSETAGLSCCNFPFSKAQLGSIGTPLDCVEMKLSDNDEILIRGDAVFKEYYQDPEATAQSFTDGWLHTGDCAHLNPDGSYKIVGRIKEQFKTSKGKYVVPVPIESLLYTNPNIAQVCVMGSGLKQPIALIDIHESCRRKDPVLIKSLNTLLSEINTQLEKHEQLDYLFICQEAWSIENGLLTATMKLKRNELEKRYQTLISREYEGTILWEEDL